MFSLFDPRPTCYFRHCENFFGMKVVLNQQVSKKRGFKRRGRKCRGLKWTLSQMNGLKWMVSNEWSQMNGLNWMVSNEWSQMNGLKWMVSNELVSIVTEPNKKVYLQFSKRGIVLILFSLRKILQYTMPFQRTSIFLCSNSNKERPAYFDAFALDFQQRAGAIIPVKWFYKCHSLEFVSNILNRKKDFLTTQNILNVLWRLEAPIEEQKHLKTCRDLCLRAPTVSWQLICEHVQTTSNIQSGWKSMPMKKLCENSWNFFRYVQWHANVHYVQFQENSGEMMIFIEIFHLSHFLCFAFAGVLGRCVENVIGNPSWAELE